TRWRWSWRATALASSSDLASSEHPRRANGSRSGSRPKRLHPREGLRRFPVVPELLLDPADEVLDLGGLADLGEATARERQRLVETLAGANVALREEEAGACVVGRDPLHRLEAGHGVVEAALVEEEHAEAHLSVDARRDDPRLLLIVPDRIRDVVPA